jgi:hypothetical protein
MPNSFQNKSFKKAALAAMILSAGLAVPASAAVRIVTSADLAVHNGVDEFSARGRGGGGGGGGGGHRGGGAHMGGGGAHMGGAGRAHVSGGRAHTNVNAVGRTNVSANVRRTNVGVAGRRPVRGWVHRPYYGRIVGGVALGAVIGVAVVGTAPVAPAENMCWYWSDSGYSQGYWDYCQIP